MADPLPLLLKEHLWPEVADAPGTTHHLIPVGETELLDWTEETGHFDHWVPSPGGVTTSAVPEPYNPTPRTTGAFRTIATGHALSYLAHSPGNFLEGNMLDLEGATKRVRIFRFERFIATGDPMPVKVNDSRFSTIGTGHELIYLDRDRVLDFEPAIGRVRVWEYNRNRPDSDPLPTKVTEQTWGGFVGHRLTYLGGDLLLDWDPIEGGVVVWRYDRIVSGDDVDAFPTEEMRDDWSQWLPPDRKLCYLGNDLVLEREPATGFVRIWDFDRPVMPDFHFLPMLSGDRALAASWVAGAIGAISAYQAGIFTGFPTPAGFATEAILDTHFRVRTHPSGVLAASRVIQDTWTRALSRLTAGADVFGQVSKAQALAELADPAFPGVRFYRDAYVLPGMAIRLSPNYRPFDSVDHDGLGDRNRAALLIRKAVEFEIGNNGTQVLETDGTYATLLPEFTVANHATYAACAHHLTTGRDLRFGKEPWE
jgi:hypothetical protein